MQLGNEIFLVRQNKFFEDTIDTPQKDIGQQKKQGCVKGVIGKGEISLLNDKKLWVHEKVDKASNKTINNAYAEYDQHELNLNGENTGKALGKLVISMYLTSVYQVVQMRDVHKLQHDIENDPIITDQMDNLGCLLARTFVNFLAFVLVAVHIITSL